MNPHTFKKASTVRTGTFGKKSLIDTLKDAGSAALHKRMHPAITLSFSLFAAAAFGSGVMYQIHSEPVPVVGKVLGDSVMAAEIPLVRNASLRLSVQPATTTGGLYAYTISWTRSKDAAGSVYVSPYQNATDTTFSLSPAPRASRVVTPAVFNPGSRYRVEFYRGANKAGGLLARKFFVVPALPTTPIAMCDYAAPPVGCRYVRGPAFSEQTQCGLVLSCEPIGCIDRPACLDTTVGIRCALPEPVGGWCSGRSTTSTSTIACTQEARQCPDGSYVGRRGPSCEFAPCPVPRGISVVYPQGGESLSAGSEVTLRWSGNSRPVDIYLLYPRPTCLDARPACAVMEKEPVRIASGVSGDSYRWTVRDPAADGTSIPARSQYKLRVQVAGGEAGESSAMFSIVNIFQHCSVLCAAPPANCHYVSDGRDCSCGVLSCEDTTR